MKLIKLMILLFSTSAFEANVKPDSYGVYGVSLFEFSDYLNNI